MTANIAPLGRTRTAAALLIVSALMLVMYGNGQSHDPRLVTLSIANAAVGIAVLLNPPGWRRTALLLVALELAATVALGTAALVGSAPLIIEMLGSAVLLEGALRVPPLVALIAIEAVAVWLLRAPRQTVASPVHA